MPVMEGAKPQRRLFCILTLLIGNMLTAASMIEDAETTDQIAVLTGQVVMLTKRMNELEQLRDKDVKKLNLRVEKFSESRENDARVLTGLYQEVDELKRLRANDLNLIRMMTERIEKLERQCEYGDQGKDNNSNQTQHPLRNEKPLYNKREVPLPPPKSPLLEDSSTNEEDSSTQLNDTRSEAIRGQGRIQSRIKRKTTRVIKIDMCTETAITLTLEGAENGGIIYIKGAGAACKQDTVNVTTELQFIFDACGIDPYTAFSVVVQKRPHYQTGNDIVVPVQCLYDFNIELSGSETIAEGVDEQGINITIRPTATMTIYTNGQEVTTGQVHLTDILTMSIQLGSEYMADFDLKAKYCTANTLEVIEDYCSTDTELFPNFVRPVQGVIASSFGAFRTTDLNAGVVDMVFSCTLQLCFGACSQKDCAHGETGYGRKKRFADIDEKGNKTQKRRADPDDQFDERRKKRLIDEEDVAFENMNVGAVIGVGNIPDSDVKGDVTDDICIHLGILAISGTLVVFLVIGCTVSMTSLLNKQRKGKDKKQPCQPEVTKPDVSVYTTASLSTSRFGTTTTRRLSGQFMPV